MDYGEFLEHYRLDDMARVNMLFVKAFEAYEAYTHNLDVCYNDYLEDFNGAIKGRIKTLLEYEATEFEHYFRSAEDEAAYGFLRLIVDTLDG